jgi:hypothetical protein
VNAQDKVLECFPNGEARNERAICQHGIDFSVEDSYWVIFAGPEFDADELGWGRSETEAWSDAAGLLGNQAA